MNKSNPRTNGDIIQSKNSKFKNLFATISLVLVAIFCCFTIFVTRKYEYANVAGSSMFPTINAQYYFQGNSDKLQLAYYTQYKSAKKGDIIIVDYGASNATSSNVDAIKRLIATGGDTICFYQNKILLNGAPLVEKYMEQGYQSIKENKSVESADHWLQNGYDTCKQNFEKICKAFLDGTAFASAETGIKTEFAKNCQNAEYANQYVKYNSAIQTYVLTIPQDYVFFLGDNRAVSNDCSHFGPIESKYVLAKVDFVIDSDSTIFGKLAKEMTNIFA